MTSWSPVLCLFLVWLFQQAEAIGEKTDSADAVAMIPTSRIRLSYKDLEKRETVILGEGDSVTLECEFSSTPWSYIQWLKIYFTDDYKHEVLDANKTFTNGSSTISSVYLRDVSRNDGGNFSCISANTLGTTALEFYVSVKEKTYCNGQICGVNGACEELLNGYACKCSPGYTGQHCELADHCFCGPCLNNGTCTDSEDGFLCICAPGYKGKTCEREACLPSSCHNAGNCSETDDGKIQCMCAASYAGKYCESRCRFSGRYCRNGGRTCVISSRGTESCSCHSYDRNKYCIHQADVVNECADPDICNRRGTCQDQIYKYTCNCRSYASGKNCEFYDECRANTNLCWNYGGTCIDKPVGYKCQCPAGQHGNDCQYSSKPCTVTCNDDRMTARCNMDFLSDKLRNIPLRSNPGEHQCVFRNRISSRQTRRYFGNYGYRRRYEATFNGDIPYSRCETEIELKEDYIIYRNSLRGGIRNVSDTHGGVVTRQVGFFLFEMECKQPLILNETSVGIRSISLHSNESLHTRGKDDLLLQTQVAYYDKDWDDRITKYEVGERLYVKLQLTRPTNNQILSNIVLRPMKCYATPRQGLDEPRYILLENGCVKDDTFRFEEYEGRYNEAPAAYFSFKSFAFTGRNDNTLYLHCDSKICVNTTKNLEKCKNSCPETAPTDARTSNATTSTDVSLRRKRDVGILASIGSFFSRNFPKKDSIIERKSKGIVRLIELEQ